MQRIVLLLCFFIPLLSQNCFGAVKPGSSEIDKLLIDKQPVMFEITRACEMKCETGAVAPGKGIKQLFVSTTCQMSNSAPDEEPSRIMVHDDGERNKNIGKHSPRQDLGFRAMFLKQFPNTVSYMILDSIKAHWFFTNELSGCDIFIAMKKDGSQPDMPMVFHANMDDLHKPEDQVDNLKWKGDKVDAILSGLHYNYALKMRLHITPENPKPANYDQYWRSYKAAHRGVKVHRYNFDVAKWPPQSQFYGHYVVRKGWKFFTKSKASGKVDDIPV